MSFGALPSGDFFLGLSTGRSQGEADGFEEGMAHAQKWKNYARQLEAELAELRANYLTVAAGSVLRAKALEELGHPLGARIDDTNNKFLAFWRQKEIDNMKKNGLLSVNVSADLKRPEKASDWY